MFWWWFQMFSFSLQGLDQLLQTFNKMDDIVAEAIKKALIENGFHLLSESIQEAPIETGNLRGSGIVVLEDKVLAQGDGHGGISIKSRTYRQNNATSTVFSITVGYNTVYALKQHELQPKPGQTINYSDPNTKNKFLEDPLKANIQKYQRNVVTAIQDALRRL